MSFGSSVCVCALKKNKFGLCDHVSICIVRAMMMLISLCFLEIALRCLKYVIVWRVQIIN